MMSGPALSPLGDEKSVFGIDPDEDSGFVLQGISFESRKEMESCLHRGEGFGSFWGGSWQHPEVLILGIA